MSLYSVDLYGFPCLGRGVIDALWFIPTQIILADTHAYSNLSIKKMIFAGLMRIPQYQQNASRRVFCPLWRPLTTYGLWDFWINKRVCLHFGAPAHTQTLRFSEYFLRNPKPYAYRVFRSKIHPKLRLFWRRFFGFGTFTHTKVNRYLIKGPYFNLTGLLCFSTVIYVWYTCLIALLSSQ